MTDIILLFLLSFATNSYWGGWRPGGCLVLVSAHCWVETVGMSVWGAGVHLAPLSRAWKLETKVKRKFAKISQSRRRSLRAFSLQKFSLLRYWNVAGMRIGSEKIGRRVCRIEYWCKLEKCLKDTWKILERCWTSFEIKKIIWFWGRIYLAFIVSVIDQGAGMML